MVKMIISLILIILCIIRITSYGIYTIKEKNMTGGIALFFILAVTVAANVYTML